MTLVAESGFPAVETSDERIDNIPPLLYTLVNMGVPGKIDQFHTPHGNHEGLSVGWLSTVWLVYILSQRDHRMSYVQDWVNDRRSALSELIGQEIRETDFTDDRLADVLGVLNLDAVWQLVEAALSQQSIRVYRLPAETVRLDATVGQSHHDPSKHPLFQVGRTKADTYDIQFKLMLGSLDPLGLPIAADIVPGNQADDPLYVPIYQRIRQTLGKKNLLYVGDSKMAALETRAAIQEGEDFYLMPLPMTGETPDLLDQLLTRLDAGEIASTEIYLPEDLPKDPQQSPDPSLAIAKGFETSIERTAVVDGETATWTERVLTVQSFHYAEAQQKALESRLKKAEKNLLKLTPPSGRGKKQSQEADPLQAAVERILDRYHVQGLLGVALERQESQRPIRSYGERPARIETTVRYQVYVTRQTEKIAQVKRSLGWRLYAANSPVERLSLNQAVLVYRDQYIVERDFARIHGYLKITPLYVQRDDHARGLIRLLTIALRAMVLIEFVARRALEEQQTKLEGIYAGNPKRATARPTAELLLKAFEGIARIATDSPNGQCSQDITPLTPVQKKILSLLNLPVTIYTNLVTRRENTPLLPMVA
jgi:transposase